MPPRSLISQLPEEIKNELDRRLIQSAFGGYVALEGWLEEQGYKISKSAIHVYGQQFEERVAALKLATEQAKAIIESVGDDEGALGDALTRVAQQKAFEILVNLESIKAEDINLPQFLRGIAALNKASVDQKKWQMEVREKIDKRLKQLEEENSGISRTLDPKTLQRVREEIYGLF